MRNRIVEEKMKDIERLTDVIYSAGMDEESEELQEIWNSLVVEIERLEKALKDILDTPQGVWKATTGEGHAECLKIARQALA